MTNAEKDEIIESVTQNQQILESIITAISNSNEEVQLYSVRIIGNILAERDDYSELFTKFNIIDKLSPILQSPNPQIKKDVLWLLSNYIFDAAPSNHVLSNQQIFQQLLTLHRS
jgi:hypothetical protein